MLFTGADQHTLDSKQRLAIPATTRSAMERANMPPSFYAVPGPKQAIWLWPVETFERMSASMEPTLMPGASMLEFDEMTYPCTRRIEIDGAGRIRLPQDLLDEVPLGPNVMVLGMRDHLELRDPEIWKREASEFRARRMEIMIRARDAYLGSSPRNDRTDGGGERGPSAGNG